MGGSCCGFGCGGSGRGWWRLSEPLVKDKDLKGWVCGGVKVHGLVMMMVRVKGWNFGGLGFC